MTTLPLPLLSVSGEPAPTVSWHKDGIPCGANSDYLLSRSGDGVCSLVIEETLVEDTAVFTCRAENPAGVAETSGRLTVQGGCEALSVRSDHCRTGMGNWTPPKAKQGGRTTGEK